MQGKHLFLDFRIQLGLFIYLYIYYFFGHAVWLVGS